MTPKRVSVALLIEGQEVEARLRVRCRKEISERRGERRDFSRAVREEREYA